MARTKAERLQQVFEDAMASFQIADNAVYESMDLCLKDRRFCAIPGAQFEFNNLNNQFENRPKYQINKLSSQADKLLTDFLQNQIDVSFIAADGSDNQGFADFVQSLFRADEYYSQGKETKKVSFREASVGGFGAMRLRVSNMDGEDYEYGDEEENLRVCFEPIYDACKTVRFDANAKAYDKRDAKKCWVVTMYSREAAEMEFGELPPPFPMTVMETQFDWAPNDQVAIAEYYCVEHKREKIRVFQNQLGETTEYTDEDFSDNEELEETLIVTGMIELEPKYRKTRKVHKYIMSGGGILKDCGFIHGKYIPVVPVYGFREIIDGIERVWGMVKVPKDAQCVLNMLTSTLVQYAATGGIDTPVLFNEQVAPYQHIWANATIDNPAYLPINPVTDSDGNKQYLPPIGNKPAPQIPPVLSGLMALTDQSIKELTGNLDNAEKILSHTSSSLVENIQSRVDAKSITYMDSFADAMRWLGKVWLSIAKEIYTEEKSYKTMNAQGKTEMIKANMPIIDKDSKKAVKFDMSKAEFDVVVEVGPASATRKQAAVKTFTNLMGMVQDPETAQILASVVMMNLDSEGSSDVAEFYRKKLVMAGVVKGSAEEQAQLEQAQQNQQPDPNAQYLQAEAMKSQAEAVKAQADTQFIAAKTKESEAKTAEILARLSLDERKQVVDTILAMQKNSSTSVKT